MFYTLPEYEFAPGVVDFEAMGGEAGTRVWRAVRLSVPKFWFLVEYHGAERQSLPQTVFCAEVEAVLGLLSEPWITLAKAYVVCPGWATTNGHIEMRPLVEILEGTYRPGLLKPLRPAYVFVTEDGQRYVEIAELEERDIKNARPVWARPLGPG